MAKHGLIKVTIVGYYTVSELDMPGYGLETFDLNAVAAHDSEDYRNGGIDAEDIIFCMDNGRPTSVTFEVVDMSDVDPKC